jgi:hypothetical protein
LVLVGEPLQAPGADRPASEE